MTPECFFTDLTPEANPWSQAVLTWSWCQWLCQKARAAGKVPLMLNLDETAVPLEYTHTRGNIIVRECRRFSSGYLGPHIV